MWVASQFHSLPPPRGWLGLRTAMPGSSKTSGLENIRLMTLEVLVLGDQKSDGFLAHGSSHPNLKQGVSWKSLPQGPLRLLRIQPVFGFGIFNWFTRISRFKTKQRLESP